MEQPTTRRARRAVAGAVVAGLVGAVLLGGPADAGRGEPTPAAVSEGGAAIGVGWFDWFRCLFGCATTTTTTVTTAPSSSSSSSSSSTTAPTTTTTAPDPECRPLPKAGGGTWQCAFSDEFDGTELDRTAWTPHQTALGGHDGGFECYVDDPDNVAVRDGALHLTVRAEAQKVPCGATGPRSYTSGMVTLLPSGDRGFAQTYGRYEIRARVTGAKVKGLQESFWMYPVTPRWWFPWSGEIDIAEIYHRFPDRAVPYVHYSNTSDPNRTNNSCLIDDIAEFHSYVLEWTPQTIRILYDGEVCIDDPWKPWFPQMGRQPFDAPFFLVLTQALGVGTNAFDPAVTPLPASTVVDHVRIWR